MRKICLSMFMLFLVSLTISDNAYAGDAENQVVGECAAKSGGVPAVFVACAAKQLALAELVKCIDGTGCFGPGNTLVEFNDWFNRNILGTCGAFHSQGEKEHQFLVMNNSNVTVNYAAEAEQSDRTDFSLAPGEMALLTFDWCDNWVNIYGPDGEFSYDMGGVMEFVSGPDGNVQQYVVVKKQS